MNTHPFLSAMRAEFLKLKRTLALWLIVIMPSVATLIVVLQFVRLYELPPEETIWYQAPPQVEVWRYLISEITSFWALLLLPLFIPLQAALINGVEHGANTWKQLFALPAARWTILGSKYFMLLLTVIAVFMVMVIEIILCGLLLIARIADFQSVVLMDAFPLDFLMMTFFSQIAASLFLIAIHGWLSIRLRSFTAAIGAGIAGTVLSYFFNQNPIGQYFPYSIPGLVTSYVTDSGIRYYAQPEVVPSVIVYSLIFGVVLTIIGIFSLARRDIL
ncbi:MAG: ABC transporter permease [Armatimonadetes bacterium]|nr:ABC transporter permease [Anaerolineae bacterium]